MFFADKYSIILVYSNEKLVIVLDRLLSKLREELSYRLPPSVMKSIRPFLTIQFFIFMGIGIVNTFFAAVIATLLDVGETLILPPNHAILLFAKNFRANFITGYIASIVLSFFLNSKYTFCRKPTLKRFIKFPISYIPNFLFQYIMVFIFTSLHWNSTAAYITAAILGTPITFISMKLMVFQKKK